MNLLACKTLLLRLKPAKWAEGGGRALAERTGKNVAAAICQKICSVSCYLLLLQQTRDLSRSRKLPKVLHRGGAMGSKVIALICSPIKEIK